MAIPVNKDLVILQGATFLDTVTWLEGDDEVPSTLEAVNLESFAAYMHIKATHDSKDILCAISSADEEITFNEDEGEVHIMIPASKTAALPWKQILLYDLKLIDTSNQYTYRLAEGKVTVKPEITRITLPSS